MMLHSVWHGIWLAATSSPLIVVGFIGFVLLTTVRLVHTVASPPRRA